MLKKLWWLIGPVLVALAGLVMILLVFGQEARFSQQTLKNASVSLDTAVYKGKAVKSQAFTDSKVNYLPIFGSSELSRMNSFHMNVMAEKYKRDYQPFLLGKPGTQSLSQYFALQQNTEDLKGKKAVFIISPQWFTKIGQDPSAFSEYFSKGQAVSFLSDVADNTTGDRYAAKRLLTMLGDSAPDKMILNKVSEGKQLSQFDKTNLNWQTALLEREESLFSRLPISDSRANHIQKMTRKLPDTYDKDQLLDLASRFGHKRTTNNKFRIANDFYESRLKQDIKQLAGSQRHFDYRQSPEYNDFELLLNLFADKQMDVLFVIPPVNSEWVRYTGLNEAYYEAAVDKILYQLKSQGFNQIADFSKDGNVPYFMEDTIHMGWVGWVYLDQEITKFMTQPARQDQLKIDDFFYSRDWANQLPKEVR